MSPKTNEQNEEIRREKSNLISETALTLFAEKGYHATSISKIATTAGVSKGLIYNYYSSKEELLQKIFEQIIQKITPVLEPIEGETFTKEESELFIDRMFELLIDNPKEWRLFFQLSMQNEVLEVFMKNLSNHNYDSPQNIMLNFFSSQNFENPEVEVLLFASISKGFVMQYAFAPELFDDELLNKFKAKLKELFINTSANKGNNNTELDDKLRYFLM